MNRLGSSPLTRGKQVARVHADRVGGLIPAHAGKTSAEPDHILPHRAHPRSRGENRPCDSHSAEIAGSSPLTRGKPATYQVTAKLGGLIPAHAGKTSRPPWASYPAWAHPRSCGENTRKMGFAAIVAGSSPLTRGKQAASRGCCVAARLIPAHARKTPARPEPQASARAHPHSHGENKPPLTAFQIPPGSSPLTRGNLRVVRAGQVVDGLIPAHAGKACARCANAS